jgi:hypothetical protein
VLTLRLLTIVGVLLGLACSPLDSVVSFTQRRQTLATAEAIVNQGDYLALNAADKLHKLPGYTLEGHHLSRDRDGNSASYQLTITQDAAGNSHTIQQMPTGQRYEMYMVAGSHYYFDPLQQGWVTSEGGSEPANTLQANFPLPWLRQMGAVPMEAGQETIAGRPAIRYNLNFVTPQLLNALDGTITAAPGKTQGTIWVDEETGALLKFEMLFFESNNSTQPEQEFKLEVSQVGGIAEIDAPAPPPASGPLLVPAATATAQARAALQVTVTFQGQPITFSLIPVAVQQTSPDSATLQLILQQLPAPLLSEPQLSAFLQMVGAQLTLSIPQKNLTTTSNTFQIEATNPDLAEMQVSFLFNADVLEFEHVELIVSGNGNPIFAPVPVTNQ